MTIGPIQLVAITFKDFKPRGKILEELLTLNKLGTIRLIDLQFIKKDSNGNLSELELSGLTPEEKQQYGSVLGNLLNADAAGAVQGDLGEAVMAVEQSYGLSLDDFRAVADSIRPNSAAGLMLIEHAWARKFSQAVQDAGGMMTAQGFLTRQTLALVGRELEARVQAIDAIAVSQAIQVEAARRAARAIALSQAIQEEAANRAVGALVAAELIAEAALDEAIDIVMDAELVEEEALEEAEALVTAVEEAGVLVTGVALTRDLAYVEGIGDVYAAKLNEVGVDSPQALLERGATPQGRKELAEATGISDHLILKWVNAVDLYRIKGLGTQYAELLRAAGVSTVVELAQRNPENLYAKVIEVNEERRHVRRAPTQVQIDDWVDQAKDLPRMITY